MQFILVAFKSNERIEDSYIGLADLFFFVFFFRKKSQNIDALRYNALFEFNLNLSAENDVYNTLQIRAWKWCKKKRVRVSSFESGISGMKTFPIDLVFSG